jgi:galactonate dehydratase
VALQARAGSDPLEITGIKLWNLREPTSGRRYTVIRLDTRSGLKGYGEFGYATAGQIEAARKGVIGTSASAYDVNYRRMEAFGAVRAAINIAQLDILGKQSKAPIYQVLGGPTRFKVRALASLPSADKLSQGQAAGYKAFSIRPPQNEFRNAGKGYVDKVFELVSGLRKEGGPNTDFVLNGSASFVPGDAQSLAAKLEHLHLLWFDEPTRLGNLGAIKKIAAESVTPLGFGRGLQTAGEFQELLREDAVDILRPEIGIHGISGIRRIAAVAEVYYTAVAPVHTGGPIGTAAACQLAAALPNFFIQQIPQPRDNADAEMRKSILNEPVETVKDGFAALPTGPGLGITVNEAALDKYQERG